MGRKEVVFLGIDTSSFDTSVCLYKTDGNYIAKFSCDTSNAEILISLIHEALSDFGADISDLSAIFVATGPGSYTGIRSGISTAQGLGIALGIPVIGVPIFLSRLAYYFIANEIKDRIILVPYLKANSSELFYGIFSVERKPSVAIEHNDLLAKLLHYNVETIAASLVCEASNLRIEANKIINDFLKVTNKEIFFETFSVEPPLKTELNNQVINTALLIVLAGYWRNPMLFGNNFLKEKFSISDISFEELLPLYGKKVNALTIEQRRNNCNYTI